MSIARGVGIRRKIIEEDPHGEVSPQDLLDHIWFYFKEERQKDQDKRGFYQCKHSTAYRFIEEMGACFLEDYAFEGRLDEHRGPIHKTEVHIPFSFHFVSGFTVMYIDSFCLFGRFLEFSVEGIES